MKKIVFSGIQPSGVIHIGNYLGAIKNWVKLQNEADESYFCIVDYHAITAQSFEPLKFQETISTNLAIYLACGLDPQKAIIFQQSDVSEHTELAWILNSQTMMGELNRMTQYKEKTEGQESSNVGLFDYPVLQAADILLYNTNLVPVGEDQIQHIELTRDIARRFNHKFADIFIEPKPYVTETSRIMALNNPNRKMSKSLEGSYIALTDTADMIKKHIQAAVTDSARDGSGPGAKNLLLLLSHFADDQTITKYKTAAANNELTYRELKADLAEAIIEFIEPLQTKINSFLADQGQLEEILTQGSQKAQTVAITTLNQVRAALGLSKKRI